MSRLIACYVRLACCLTLGLATGCDPQWTASLGGVTPGGRGSINVVFVNNTPFFASFTMGTYDPANEGGAASIQQFFADPDHPDQRLERNTISDTISLTTGRVLALGTRGLLDRIRSTDTTLDLTTLKDGVTFSDKLLTEDGVQTVLLNGFEHQELALGKDMVTDSLVIFTFEPDAQAAGGIRVDVDVILPAEQ